MKNAPLRESGRGRPVVYDYGVPVRFLNELWDYYKSDGSFSLRQRAVKVGFCSQSLLSQILRGKRQLTRDNFPAIAAVFKLTQLEIQYIDRKLSPSVHKFNLGAEREPKTRHPKNHLLTDWLNPYVKDLVNIHGFQAEPEVLFSMLKGIVPITRIKKSVEFLLREGFLRRGSEGQVVPEEAAVTTTNEIPNEKIRTFHRRALEIAARGVVTLPPNKRKASTVLISIDEENIAELRSLLDSFQQQLLGFIERHPSGRDSLVQVAIHLTPIGDSPHV